MTFPRKIFPSLLLLVIAVGLTACDPPEAYDQVEPIAEGTSATMKISGHLYRAEVTHAKEGYVLWSYLWKKKPVFRQKTYRGLLSVYNEEENYKNWSKFDTAIIDSLFPMEVGATVVLEGRHFSEREEQDYPFTVTISVREKSEIDVAEDVYPVFILDFVFVEEQPDGTRTYTKTAWYSEELETAILTEYLFSDTSFSMRIVSLDEPEANLEEDIEPEGLGTIRL